MPRCPLPRCPLPAGERSAAASTTNCNSGRAWGAQRAIRAVRAIYLRAQTADWGRRAHAGRAGDTRGGGRAPPTQHAGVAGGAHTQTSERQSRVAEGQHRVSPSHSVSPGFFRGKHRLIQNHWFGNVQGRRPQPFLRLRVFLVPVTLDTSCARRPLVQRTLSNGFDIRPRPEKLGFQPNGQIWAFVSCVRTDRPSDRKPLFSVQRSHCWNFCALVSIRARRSQRPSW